MLWTQCLHGAQEVVSVFRCVVLLLPNREIRYRCERTANRLHRWMTIAPNVPTARFSKHKHLQPSLVTKSRLDLYSSSTSSHRLNRLTACAVSCSTSSNYTTKVTKAHHVPQLSTRSSLSSLAARRNSWMTVARISSSTATSHEYPFVEKSSRRIASTC